MLVQACNFTTNENGARLEKYVFQNPIEKHYWIKERNNFPDSIPNLNLCAIDSAFKVEAYAELSFKDYINRNAQPEQLEAYWRDWSWINRPDSTAQKWLFFDFGQEGKMLPFLLEDGFFPGAISGWAGLWQDGEWLCISRIEHYSIQDFEFETLNMEKEDLTETLFEDFQNQFWTVVRDTFQHKLLLPKTFRAG